MPDEEDIPIAADEGFGRTLLHMRGRETAEHLVPDLPASIRATVSGGGVPVFRYRSPTRPREYLLLIDRYSLDDHRAALFDHLFRELRSGGVIAERFYYQGDPRTCRNERWPQGISLPLLRYRYPDALLIVLGNGYNLLSAKDGELLPSLRPLSGWQRRALLTPVSRHRWGRRENTLENLFALLPANSQSFHYLATVPDGPLQGAYEALPAYLRSSAEFQPVILEGSAPRALRRHFDPGTLAWIAACAVYPALHFELTLRLGRLVSEQLGYPLLSVQYLLPLSRLHWFTEGRIPPPARAELTEWLEHRHPELYRAVLDYLQGLMEQNPPPPNSIAHTEHQINLALLDLARGPRPETLEQLRSIVKYLDRPLQRGDFVLPAHWQHLLRKIGQEAEPAPGSPLYIPEGMVYIPAGSFDMGAGMGDKEQEDELPVHRVSLDAFCIGRHAVTFAEYDAFCEATKREKPGDEGWGRGKRPVINVSWDDAVAYCNWRSAVEGFEQVYKIVGGEVTLNENARGYRLPTEAEWEYAAREGGKRVRFGNGKDIADPREINFDARFKYVKSYSVAGKYRGKTLEVGSLPPNALGLYEMSGNVWEWCQYGYGPYPSTAYHNNPKGLDTGSYRVCRGGSWGNSADGCRVAIRNGLRPDSRHGHLGFRAAFVPPSGGSQGPFLRGMSEGAEEKPLSTRASRATNPKK